jgi:DNA-binding NarL/FixJ family response regulator
LTSRSAAFWSSTSPSTSSTRRLSTSPGAPAPAGACVESGPGRSRLIAEFAPAATRRHPCPGLAQLTDRERGILLLVARGLGNNEITGRLVISPLTAKSHVRSILRKLDCHDRAGLVALAYESGLIKPGEGK